MACMVMAVCVGEARLVARLSFSLLLSAESNLIVSIRVNLLYSLQPTHHLDRRPQSTNHTHTYTLHATLYSHSSPFIDVSLHCRAVVLYPEGLSAFWRRRAHRRSNQAGTGDTQSNKGKYTHETTKMNRRNPSRDGCDCPLIPCVFPDLFSDLSNLCPSPSPLPNF